MRSSLTLAFGYATVVVAVASGLLTVAKEKHEPLLLWMKAATPHHWITHGIAVILLFVLVGLAFLTTNRAAAADVQVKYNRLSVMLIAATVVGGALVGLLYLLG
jgi:hypothetical protein